MKKIRAILIGAGSRGYSAYAPYTLEYPEKMQFVAVADPDVRRREAFCRAYGVAQDQAFEDYQTLLKAAPEADVAFICTQDNYHTEPALMALEAGYHIVLEKPMATCLSECEEIASKAAETGKEMLICFVLRYTPFWSSVKSIIEQGEVGDVISVSLTEHVGFEHAAHSYVRGNWRCMEESSPMLLAKSSHDIDLLSWLVDSPCKQVASFGGLKHFTGENAPAGSGKRCTEGCAVKSACPFDAEKIYLDPKVTGWPVNVITSDVSPEGRRKALQTGPYGRCVYHCDNDVVDHQVVILEYENGATANFSMNSLSASSYREVNVYGSRGQLFGRMEENAITKKIYGQPDVRVETMKPDYSEYGHGGGDKGFMHYVCERLSQDEETRAPERIPALISHRICFAAERARAENTVIVLV